MIDIDMYPILNKFLFFRRNITIHIKQIAS